MKYSGLAVTILLCIIANSLQGNPQRTTVRRTSRQVYYPNHIHDHHHPHIHQHLHHTAHIHYRPARYQHIHHDHIDHIHHNNHVHHAIHNHQPIHHVAHHEQHAHAHNHLFHSSARDFVAFARLAYCPKANILAKTCTVCPAIFRNYKAYFIHTINEKKKRLFQFVILYSDTKKEIVVSFSGPTTNQVKFFSKVYKKGFKTVKALGNVKIEKFYWQIYSKYIRKVLQQKIKKVIKSKRGGYRFTFVGHSFGGSIATLATYDLVLNKVLPVNKKLNSPIVYTYGLMRIGDANFVKKVNKLFKVIRIVRSDDFVTRVPSCVYDAAHHNFRCYRRANKIIRHYPSLRRYFVVYRRGLRWYRKSIVRRVHSHAHQHGNHLHSHYHSYYSQPLGTLIYYSGSNFTSYNVCKYVGGIPLCEKQTKLPSTFSHHVHAHYFSVNVEAC